MPRDFEYERENDSPIVGIIVKVILAIGGMIMLYFWLVVALSL